MQKLQKLVDKYTNRKPENLQNETKVKKITKYKRRWILWRDFMKKIICIDRHVCITMQQFLYFRSIYGKNCGTNKWTYQSNIVKKISPKNGRYFL